MAAAFAPVLNNVVVIGIFIWIAARYNHAVPLLKDGKPVVRDGRTLMTVHSTAGDTLAGRLTIGLGTTAGIAVIQATINGASSPNMHTLVLSP